MNNSIAIPQLSISKFREMDYAAVNRFHLPIELMMENAGLNLARLAALHITSGAQILIGIGKGNNGGGGLVAARRLLGWGYKVWLHIPDEGLNPLAQTQLERALAFGAKTANVAKPDLFVDAYLGFSQRLPLSATYNEAVKMANELTCLKISLDLPTGFDHATGESIFKPDIILTLAAMKKELLLPAVKANLYVADLGIPATLYYEFGVDHPVGFATSGVLEYLKEAKQ